MIPTITIPTGPDDLTAEYLNGVLAASFDARVVAVEARRIGTGQVSDSVRLSLTWDPAGAGPDSVVAKVASASEVSRAAARATGTYEIEVGFYTDLAPHLPVRAPFCHHAARDPETEAYVVLLEDLAPAVQGDQLAGCSVADASLALDEAALLHGPRWGDSSLAQLPWLNRQTDAYPDELGVLVGMTLSGFLERLGGRLSPDVVELAQHLPALVGPLARLGREGARTVSHGDFRTDNLLFGGERVCVVDWQTAALGPGLGDVSYFLGGSLSVDDRRAHERDLVGHYHRRLCDAGVGIDWGDCWRDYRRFAFNGLIMAVIASMLVEQTDRGDAMFVAMAEGAGRHALDLESEALVRS